MKTFILLSWLLWITYAVIGCARELQRYGAWATLKEVKHTSRMIAGKWQDYYWQTWLSDDSVVYVVLSESNDTPVGARIKVLR